LCAQAAEVVAFYNSIPFSPDWITLSSFVH